MVSGEGAVAEGQVAGAGVEEGPGVLVADVGIEGAVTDAQGSSIVDAPRVRAGGGVAGNGVIGEGHVIAGADGDAAAGRGIAAGDGQAGNGVGVAAAEVEDLAFIVAGDRQDAGARSLDGQVAVAAVEAAGAAQDDRAGHIRGEGDGVGAAEGVSVGDRLAQGQDVIVRIGDIAGCGDDQG